MIGNQFNICLADDFAEAFRINCLTLISEAYWNLLKSHRITIDFDEEQISANIFSYIDDYSKASELNIFISEECRLYTKCILDGKKSAKSAPRIDLIFSTNWTESKKKVKFYVEAKNLIENNCMKSSRKTPMNADYYHRRYITTGIDHFANGTYPQPGCILGYVLEGTPQQILHKINNILYATQRQNEQLTVLEKRIDHLEFCYKSAHFDMSIEHYWLNFTQSFVEH